MTSDVRHSHNVGHCSESNDFLSLSRGQISGLADAIDEYLQVELTSAIEEHALETRDLSSVERSGRASTSRIMSVWSDVNNLS